MADKKIIIGLILLFVAVIFLFKPNFLGALAPVDSASVLRSVSTTTPTIGSNLDITYNVKDAGVGSWGVIIEDTTGCTDNVKKVILSTDILPVVVTKKVTSSSCSFSGTYQFSSQTTTSTIQSGTGCTPEWDCGEWGNCNANSLTQTRICADTKCNQNAKTETQTCTVDCTPDCNDWSKCTCTGYNICNQARTCTKSCDQPLIQECSCTADWKCTGFSECVCPVNSTTGIQKQTCNDANSCFNPNKPIETQVCNCNINGTVCTSNWNCTDWTNCTNDKKTRTCNDLAKCGYEINDVKTETEDCGTTTTPAGGGSAPGGGSLTSTAATTTTTTTTTTKTPPKTDYTILIVIGIIAVVGYIYFRKKGKK